MDSTMILASLEACTDVLPGLYAVLGFVWLAALAWWIGERFMPAVKPAQPAAER